MDTTETLTPVATISPEHRSLAALTHLSGLASYLIPFAGIIVPIAIWMVKKDVPAIASIAKQTIALNVVVFVVVLLSAVLMLTVILIPVVLLFWLALAVVCLILPIVGAVKANDGVLYRYPVIGAMLD